MTSHRPGDDDRRSRWLPTAVFSVFALVLVVEFVVIVFFGNYRNLIEDSGVEVGFQPASAADEEARPELVKWTSDSTITSDRGVVMVEGLDGGLAVREPGELILRFRAPDAGSYLEMDYRFGRRQRGAECRLILARVASRYGVDYISRRTLKGRRKTEGTFRHNLADHAGWFELSVDVNPPAAEVGFEMTLPRLVWD
jgi:hypothetical protein